MVQEYFLQDQKVTKRVLTLICLVNMSNIYFLQLICSWSSKVPLTMCDVGTHQCHSYLQLLHLEYWTLKVHTFHVQAVM